MLGFDNGDVSLLNSPLPPVVEPPEGKFPLLQNKREKKPESKSLPLKNKNKGCEDSQKCMEDFKKWAERRLKDNDGNVLVGNPSSLCKNAMEIYSNGDYKGYWVERHVQVHSGPVVAIRVSCSYFFLIIFFFFNHFFFFFIIFFFKKNFFFYFFII
jgi:hypothetical protein